MLTRTKATLLAAWLLPAATLAQSLAVTADARWYFHANLMEMRQTVSGQALYGWLEDEVIDDVAEEFGFDPSAELDGVTVFGRTGEHDPTEAAVILHGFLAQETKDRALKRARQETSVVEEAAFGRTYYRIASEDPGFDEEEAGYAKSHGFDGAYLAFGDGGQTLVTGDRGILERFLSAGAHFTGTVPAGLIVVQADSALVHGSVDAAGLGAHGSPWDSQLFRNVERLALVVADAGGLMDIQVHVTAIDAAMAEAISNIIQGMISLKVLADEEPEAAALLEQLNVSTVGTDVRMQLVLEPEFVTGMLR